MKKSRVRARAADPGPTLAEILDLPEEDMYAYFDKLFQEIGEKDPAALQRWELGKLRKAQMEALERTRI